MTTRTKLYIASYTASAMLLLSVFSKPLHIPEAFKWVLIIGVFIPLGLAFYFIKQQNLEKQAQPIRAETTIGSAADPKRLQRKNLILMMVLGSAVGLCSPLWMPLTGTTLGLRGDFVCGMITAAIFMRHFRIQAEKAVTLSPLKYHGYRASHHGSASENHLG